MTSEFVAEIINLHIMCVSIRTRLISNSYTHSFNIRFVHVYTSKVEKDIDMVWELSIYIYIQSVYTFSYNGSNICNTGKMADNSTGDVTADGYHKYKVYNDVMMQHGTATCW